MTNTENKSSTKERKMLVTMAAIDSYLETNIVSPVETKTPGGRVKWGTENNYPAYLLDLFNNVPTLRSIITGSADFVAGDDVTVAPGVNLGSTPYDLVRQLALDEFIYGGHALQVIRNQDGEVAELDYININYLRCDEDNEMFYYSEKWAKGARDCVVYPKYIPIDPVAWSKLTDEEKNRQASSIVYVKNTNTQTYPAPLYCAAVKACELERCIGEYHLNAINNGFMPSGIINFNNGVPTQEQQEEIEELVNEKFSGYQNAMRILLSFNSSKENATTFEYPKVEDFGARYDALTKYARQMIFTAFAAGPILFGIVAESSLIGAEQNYDDAFRLYNRTRVRPVQRRIVESVEKVYGPGAITIKPYSLEGDIETNVQ